MYVIYFLMLKFLFHLDNGMIFYIFLLLTLIKIIEFVTGYEFIIIRFEKNKIGSRFFLLELKPLILYTRGFKI